MPRKRKIPINTIADIVKKYLGTIFKDNCVIVGPSHFIWTTIKNDLNNEISEKSLYTLVKCNRNNFLCLLGIEASPEAEDVCKDIEYDFHENTDSDDFLNNIDEEIKFNMTLSVEEWNSLQTSDVMYKRKHFLSRTYSVLKPGVWADIMHSHFWEQTKFPCSISYKRAKIYENGTNYCEFYGMCTTCESKLYGVLENKPSINCRAVFHCTYRGRFNECVIEKKNICHHSKKNIFLIKLLTVKCLLQQLEDLKLIK
jgi:hypothetical protein